MGKLIGIILIYIIGISLVGFLAAGILLALFYIKKRISHMTADKWELYFNNLSNKKILFRGFIIYAASLCLIGMLSFILFEIFHYEYAYTLSQCFFLIGILYAIVEYLTNKKMLLEKLNRLHQ